MKHQHSTAIVVGGSMAGMLAARVLSDHFERVLLLERDTYPSNAVARDGVPQARHLHALLPGGHHILEDLFPGIGEDWLGAGAEYLDVGADMAWRTPKGWGIRFPSGLRMLAASRPLMDLMVRRRLAAIPNVRILESTIVEALTAADGHRQVTGVVARTGGSDGRRVLEAALVVDASGRMSKAPRWLADLGYDPPGQTVVNAHLGYASRVYRRPAGPRPWKALFIQSAPPDQPRGGIAFPIEGDRWIVTMAGGGRDYAPIDDAGYLAFARSLPDDQLYELIRDAEPLSPIVGYRRMENRWLHYERMSRRPEGLIVLGDAACAFNPVYGQGITTAAQGAVALHACLEAGLAPGFAARFQRRLAQIIRTPWMLATSEDLRYRGAEGARPGPIDRFMQWYVDHVIGVTTYDTGVRLSLLHVFGMVAGPEILFRPRVVAAVLAALTRRRPTSGESGSRRHASGASRTPSRCSHSRERAVADLV